MYPIAFAAGALAFFFAASALQPLRLGRLLAAVLFGAYAVYETLVANGTLCDANCNIRVDLLLFLPLLGWAAYLGLQTAPRTGAVALLAVVCLGLTALLAAAFGSRIGAFAAGVGAIVVTVLGVRAALASRRA